DSYREVVHPSIYVKMPIEGHEREHFLVWTTTPWTLAANAALAVHPDLEYARVELNGDILYLSAKTLDVLKEPHQVLGSVKGSELVGWRYRGPFDELDAQKDMEHRVVPWDAVGEEEGTGIVHIAPGCGAEDFVLGEELGLPVLVPIDEDGCYYPGFGLLTGLHAQQVADTVFASLREKGMLYRTDQIEHRYPTCWRCGEQILFRAVSEWFISCDEIRPRMLAAARTVEWTPPSVGKRMEDWLNNMGDWCISRKRYWGLPLPFYPCGQCGTMLVVGSVEELRSLAVSGMDELSELHRPWIDGVRIRCPQCEGSLERITEVGDCWLDAGIVPFSTPGDGGYLHDPDEWAKWYPAAWVSEMREQVRLWFYSMLFMSVALKDRSPYRAVLSYEKLMDEQGRPMHKSLGNAIWFDEAANRMGADVMRWLYAGQNLQRNLLFGYGPAEEVRRHILTLWNVYSFFITYADTAGWQPPLPLGEGWGEGAPPDAHGVRRTKMDNWILGRLDDLVNLVNARLEAYDSADAVEAMDSFVEDLSNWYLRRGRRRFALDAALDDRNAAFATLHECLTTLVRLMAPFMPFLAEQMYQNLVRSCDPNAEESVHLTPFPRVEHSRFDPNLDQEIELGRAIVALGRAARSEAKIPIRQPLPALSVTGEFRSTLLSEESLTEITDELNIREVRMVEHVEQLARRIVRPNPRVLGPKLGKRFPEIDRALREGHYDLDPDGSVRVDGLVLDREEVTIALEPLEQQTFVQHTGQSRVTGGEAGEVGERTSWRAALAVSLDTRITPELRAEGLARQIAHRVQTMRKEAGLQVSDRIRLGYVAPASGQAEQVLASHLAWIQEQVGAVQVAASASYQQTWMGLLDDEEVSLSIEKA
ncbi:MAG TPA: class I tRNA ligase family protein, partial [Chloroflexota bacterium]